MPPKKRESTNKKRNNPKKNKNDTVKEDTKTTEDNKSKEDKVNVVKKEKKVNRKKKNVKSDVNQEKIKQEELDNEISVNRDINDDIVVENNEVCEPEEIVDEQVKSKKKVTYNTLDESFAKLEQEFVEIKTSLSNFRIHLRDLRKDMRRYVKDVSKRNRKRVDDGVLPPKQNPKGFCIPVTISQELCDFFGKDDGVKMNRADAGKEIHTYIKQNKLQDPNNGLNINPDNKLKNLLQLDKGDQLTYFNLQHYLNKHFIKDK